MPFGATPSRWCVCQFHHFRPSTTSLVSTNCSYYFKLSQFSVYAFCMRSTQHTLKVAVRCFLAKAKIRYADSAGFFF